MNVRTIAFLACMSLAWTPAESQVRRRPAAPPRVEPEPVVAFYGFAQGDMIYDFTQNDSLWFDTSRPSKLPSFPDQYGLDHRTWFSARQTRFGVKAKLTSDAGDMFAHLEFDMFGTGPNAGQTLPRLRLAYGQWGRVGGGQNWSPFVDPEVLPRALNAWAVNGMLSMRNLQVYWRPVNSAAKRFTLALERPGASGDDGIYADRVQVENVVLRFPAPDVSTEYRFADPRWGYVRVSGLLQWIRWDDLTPDTVDLSGKANAWGLSMSGGFKTSSRDLLHLQVTYGEGIENHFHDAPIDVGPQNNFTNPRQPVIGKALPVLGVVTYLDHQWDTRWSSSIGWSMVQVTNSDAQSPSEFQNGQYASVNALYSPVREVMMGAEFQYTYRRNFSDGFHSNGYRIQTSFRYSFLREKEIR